MKHIYAIAKAVPASTFNDPDYQSELTQEIAQVQHSAEMVDMLKACEKFIKSLALFHEIDITQRRVISANLKTLLTKIEQWSF